MAGAARLSPHNENVAMILKIHDNSHLFVFNDFGSCWSGKAAAVLCLCGCQDAGRMSLLVPTWATVS